MEAMRTLPDVERDVIALRVFEEPVVRGHRG